MCDDAAVLLITQTQVGRHPYTARPRTVDPSSQPGKLLSDPVSSSVPRAGFGRDVGQVTESARVAGWQVAVNKRQRHRRPTSPDSLFTAR